MSTKQFFNWEDINMNWEDINMNWEDISIITEVSNIINLGGGAYSDYIKNNPWNKIKKEVGEEKAKKFLKILCRINNIDYEKVIEKDNDIKITVNQIEKVFNESLKVNIKI